MNREEMTYYVHELHWHLPEETQQQAVDWLVANAPLNQLAYVFPTYSKSYWQNSVKVVREIGYPYNIAAFPSMVELFQDINWPGAEEAIEYFGTLEKQVVAPFIEAGGKQTIAEQDDQWLWFLYAVCGRLQIERALFRDGTVFDVMEKIYERDV